MENEIKSQPLCLICKEPLPDGFPNFWHAECAVCQICGGSMQSANKVIQKCLDDGGPVAHMGCYHKQTIQDLKNHKVPIFLRDLEALNYQILTMCHIVEPDQTDYSTLHSLFCGLRDAAIAVGHVLDLTKDKIRIVSRDESEEYIKVKKKERAEKQASESQTEQQKIERSAALAKERENPWLRQRRKAIEAFVNGYGLSLEVATAAVDEASRKAGKDPQTGQPLSIQ